VRLANGGGSGHDAREAAVNFCPWYPLRGAGAHAPAGPGVFQVRVARGLLAYPRGKSAMIHYGWGQDVRAAAEAFAAAYPGVDWLCRHAVGVDGVEAAFGVLVGMFVQRFGAAPRLPGPGEAGGG
jgi:hypothetical protein